MTVASSLATSSWSTTADSLTGTAEQTISRAASWSLPLRTRRMALALDKGALAFVLEAHPAAAAANTGGQYPFELLRPRLGRRESAAVTACIAASGEGVLWRLLAHVAAAARSRLPRAIR